MKKILLIEDDPVLNSNIKKALSSENWQITEVFDGMLAEKYLKKNRYDCVILDVNLPHKNGFEICAEFRKYDTHTPIVFLTAFDELEDKIKGYDLGADDYLTKPFYMRELILRISTIFKRLQKSSSNSPREDILTTSDMTINFSTKEVHIKEEKVILTPREFQILTLLVRSKGELVSKKRLVEEIWGGSIDFNTNTIEVYINFLRNKVDKPFGRDSIKTKVGYGYYFED